MRRDRARARVRHAGLRRRRGRRPRARAGLRRRLRRALRRLRGPLRLEGLPVHGGAAHPARGGPGVRRRLGRRAGDRAPGRLRPRAHPPARQREVRAGDRRGGATRASGTWWSTTTPTSTCSRSLVPDGRGAARAAARGARHQPRHAPVDLDGRAEHEVRLRAAVGAGRDRAPRRVGPARARGPAPAHRLADLRRRELPHRAGGDGRAGRRTAWSTSAAASASRT